MTKPTDRSFLQSQYLESTEFGCSLLLKNKLSFLFDKFFNAFSDFRLLSLPTFFHIPYPTPSLTSVLTTDVQSVQCTLILQKF